VRCTREELKRAWRAKVQAAHPDRGGSTAAAQEINAAYDRMLKRRGWQK
jgi:curved DNA-binding protein CbpA